MFRPFASIFLLMLLLYNAFGYYTLLACKMKQTQQIEVMGLPEEAFMIVKIPASLYLRAENTDFEYVNETINYNEKIYHIVKKRIQNDTLHLYTLRNERHEQVVSQFKEYVRNHLVIEKKSPNSNTTHKIIQSFLKEYITENNSYIVFSFFKTIYKRQLVPNTPSQRLPFPFLCKESPPPEFV